jgi:hypothetical protein
MTAAEVIEEIKRLPQEEKSKVFDYARQAAEARRLTPEEVDDLAERMVASRDRAEAQRLQDEIVKGFYGGEPHA